MNIKMEIEPSVFIPPTRVIHHITIQIMNLVLFKGASLLVSLYDQNDYIIDNKVIEIDEANYLNWSNDDNWVVNYVMQQLSLTKKVNA